MGRSKSFWTAGALEQLLRVRGNTSRLILESPRPATHLRWVHCTGPRAGSHRLYLQPQPEKEADRNKQTVEAGKDQKKPQLGNTQQAQLMMGKEISNKGPLQRERTGCRGTKNQTVTDF